MTGLEKLAGSLMVTAVAGLAQVSISNPTAIVGLGVTVGISCLALAATWGAVRSRLGAVEKKTEDLTANCATKESVEALHEKLDTALRILDTRIIDRRHP